MGVLSNTSVSASNSQALNSVAKLQGVASTALPRAASTVTDAISGSVFGLEKNATALAGGALSSAATTLSPVAAYVTKGLNSAVSLFGKGADDLASGINNLFTSSFQDTVKPGAATVQTGISDPVSTLKSTLNPNTGMYTITSASLLPTQVANLGNAVLADGTPNLTGTQLGTLLDRYQFSSPSSIIPTLLSNKKTSAVGSVYQNLFSTVATVASTAGSAYETYQTVSGQVSDLIATDGLVALVPAALQSTVMGDISGGDTYFATDVDGNVISTVSTTNTSATASLLNQINFAASVLGCTDSANYVSTNANNISYNSALVSAALYGLTNLLHDLVNCKLSAGSVAQGVLGTLFGHTAGSDLPTSSIILGAMAAPATANTEANQTAILTNPNLTSTDTTTVNVMFATLGGSASDYYNTPISTSDSSSYVDLSKVGSSTPTFTNSLLGNDIYSTVNNSSPMSLDVTGNLFA